MHDNMAHVDLKAPLRIGDGVVFDAGNPQAPEQGGNVTSVQSISSTQTRDGYFASGRVGLRVLGADMTAVSEGDLVWRSKCSQLEGRLRASYASLAAADVKRVPVSASLCGSVGQPAVLRLEVRHQNCPERHWSPCKWHWHGPRPS